MMTKQEERKTLYTLLYYIRWWVMGGGWWMSATPNAQRNILDFRTPFKQVFMYLMKKNHENIFKVKIIVYFCNCISSNCIEALKRRGGA